MVVQLHSRAEVAASVAAAPEPATAGGRRLVGRPAAAPSAHEHHAWGWPFVYLVCDLGLVFVAWVMASVGAAAAGAPLPPAGFSLAFALVAVALFNARGHYIRRLQIHTLEEARSVIAATALAAMFVLTGAELLGWHGLADDQRRTQPHTVAARRPLPLSEREAPGGHVCGREQPGPDRLVGGGEVGRITAERLSIQPELGLKPIGFLDKEPRDDTTSLAGLPVLGASWDVERVIDEHEVEHVVIAFSTAPHEVLIRIAAVCHERGIELSIVPRLFEKVTSWHTVDHIGGLPLMTVRPASTRGWQLAVKYAIDRLAAAALLLALAPVMLATALAIRWKMGSPVLFRQERVGRDGRVFEILKFRSMETGEDGLVRVTPLGVVLRRYSLDELPQLLNVLRGDMSLIGPRPERPELVSRFELEVYRYAERHRVKSGITGWAQVHGIGRGETRFSADTLARRVEWDNYYIENWSLWLDVKVLLLTAMAVFRFMQRNDGAIPTGES